MEVKPGYKQTEVGVIPEAWECLDVRGIASSARNAIVGGPFGSDLVSADYVDEGIPVIRGQNMNGQWVSGAFVFVTEKKAKSLESNLARPGDIVFTQRGTLGQVSLVPEKPFSAYLVSQSQMKVSLNRDAADPLFYHYVFTSEHQQALIRSGTIQTGVPHINLGILRDIPVQRPPLPEQRAIAGALSDVDALLGAVDQLIAKKRDLKQAAMQQLLTGQTRLPGFHGEWDVKRLGDIGRFKNGLNKDSGAFGHGSPFVNLMDVFGVNAINSSNHLGLVASTKLDRDVYDLRRGDVLFIRSSVKPSGVGLTAVVESDLAETVYSGFLIRFRDNGLLDLGFTKHCFYGETFRKNIIAASSVSANTNVNQNALGLLTIKLPPNKAEQIAIAEVLSDMDAELAGLEQRRAKTRALKQGMMQELLTGRTRLI